MTEARPIQIAVVDDNRADLAVFQRFLSRDPDHRYEIAHAPKGAAGLELILKSRPDCVLLDYRLPDMDGLELLRRLRRERKVHSVPVVMLTGSVDESLMVEALRAGAQDYLSKTNLSPENLRRAIRNAIEKVEAVRAMEHALRSRDEFLSIASHELKTPLTSLTLQMQHGGLLLNKLDDINLARGKLGGIFAKADAQLARLARLVNDLLDVSRISAGHFELNLEEVNLTELVTEVVDRLREGIAATGSEIRVETRTPIVGRFDRFRIEQVVVNLVSNAGKYGAGKPISVEVLDLGGMACVSVADQGVGISPEAQGKIFERYERGVPPKGVAGLGLGLYITRQIIEMHEGTVTVESREGRGSVFKACLPIRRGVAHG